MSVYCRDLHRPSPSAAGTGSAAIRPLPVAGVYPSDDDPIGGVQLPVPPWSWTPDSERPPSPFILCAMPYPQCQCKIKTAIKLCILNAVVMATLLHRTAWIVWSSTIPRYFAFKVLWCRCPVRGRSDLHCHMEDGWAPELLSLVLSQCRLIPLVMPHLWMTDCRLLQLLLVCAWVPVGGSRAADGDKLLLEQPCVEGLEGVWASCWNNLVLRALRGCGLPAGTTLCWPWGGVGFLLEQPCVEGLEGMWASCWNNLVLRALRGCGLPAGTTLCWGPWGDVGFLLEQPCVEGLEGVWASCWNNLVLRALRGCGLPAGTTLCWGPWGDVGFLLEQLCVEGLEGMWASCWNNLVLRDLRGCGLPAGTTLCWGPWGGVGFLLEQPCVEGLEGVWASCWNNLVLRALRECGLPDYWCRCGLRGEMCSHQPSIGVWCSSYC